MADLPEKNSKYRNAAVLLPSHGILRIPHLTSFLPECTRIDLSWKGRGDDIDVVLGWGLKHTANRARALADRKRLPYLALEDGFLRSVYPGVTGAPPLSLVVDPVGMYYNSAAPSHLENLLNTFEFEGTDLLTRARSAIEKIVAGRLSKYNHAPLLSRPLPGELEKKVLLVDQTLGDCSVTYGMADAATFERMLTAALEENPEADIIVKTHPDVVAGKKRGYLCALNHPSPRVHILAEDLNPLSVIEKADRVYVVTSQMGFEALLAGKPVECFGMPFYAGWGLTRDRQSCPRRTRQRTLEELFAAAYILYPRYLDPETGEGGTIEKVIDHLLIQRNAHLADAGRLVCTGFRWWKRPYIRRALSAPGNRVIFSDNPRSLTAADKVVVWGAGDGSAMVREAERRAIPVHRMEDGFLRSVGLGSNLVRPLSLVVDTRGIYFDPTRPSDLETLLRETDFTEELRRRGEGLRRRILRGRLSKYNVGSDEPLALSAAPGQRTLLVPGQVEDDASIRLGCVDIRTNLDLLAEVRRQNPDAFIVYKPHPDVLAGNRRGGVMPEEARRHCDLVVADRAMPICLAAVEEVHTMTSLTGFEALLQGKKVATYGLPFYAGWGLTQDRHASPRRGRSLQLDELVAAALILYPRYIDWNRGCLISAETALDRLARERAAREQMTGEDGFALRWYRKLAGFLTGVF
jgi:capsular polysaccharide export protein